MVLICVCLICRAIDAVHLSWDSLHLKHLLSSDNYCSLIPDSSVHSGTFNSQGQPLWHGKTKKILENCPDSRLCLNCLVS